ncbi:MAG TPA: hypothetical protein VHC44_03385 [Verrucomicrobiae bacterium]|nr:hypothetical protein [Verrucomicrobiae bacterium]
MIKRNSKPQSAESGQETGAFKENSQVNARIDEYIKNNPKHWEYIQSMPPERMARALVLHEVQKLDRREKMQAGVLAKLNENPEMKEHIEGLVKNLPESQRQSAMVSIAARTLRELKPKQTAGVKV